MVVIQEIKRATGQTIQEAMANLVNGHYSVYYTGIPHDGGGLVGFPKAPENPDTSKINGGKK